MDHAPNQSSPDNRAAKPAAVSPVLPTWETYYKEASRRRRAAGSTRDLRVAKQRRRWRERLSIGLSVLLVGAMTFGFYLVLR
jgi:hypothetical protein